MRLDELLQIPSDGLEVLPDPKVLAVTWVPFRHGVEITGLLSKDLASEPGLSLILSSDWWLFAGSLWCLEAKRYWVPAEMSENDNYEYLGEEMIAVYLRRRSLSRGSAAGVPAAIGAAFEDTRQRTSVSFGVRLIGSPGSPISNSVAGYSSLGKAFGCEDEQSWGWDSFIRCSTLAPQSTWVGEDVLRFMITLDML